MNDIQVETGWHRFKANRRAAERLSQTQHIPDDGHRPSESSAEEEEDVVAAGGLSDPRDLTSGDQAPPPIIRPHLPDTPEDDDVDAPLESRAEDDVTKSHDKQKEADT